MELRGHRRANKPQSGLVSRHFFKGLLHRQSQRRGFVTTERAPSGRWPEGALCRLSCFFRVILESMKNKAIVLF